MGIVPVVPREELLAVFGATATEDVVAEALHEPVASATAGIWRVRESSRSAVLKLLAHTEGGHPNWQSGDDPGHWYYWRREACAYESGLLSALRGGLRAPRPLLVRERDDGSVALWLEDVRGAPGTTWSVDAYGVAARRLGHAQGAFLDDPLPSFPWLARDWMRSYLAQRPEMTDAIDEDALWQDPRVADCFDVGTVARIRGLRDDGATFLDALDGVPRTLCHLDLHPANLFDDVDATTLVDWSFVGIAAVGEDAGNLVPDAVFDFHVKPEHLPALYETVAIGYEGGLRDAGHDEAAAEARLAMACTIAAKYVWIAPAIAKAVSDGRELLNRRPIGDTLRYWLPTVEFVLDRADEARRLVSAR